MEKKKNYVMKSQGRNMDLRRGLIRKKDRVTITKQVKRIVSTRRNTELVTNCASMDPDIQDILMLSDADRSTYHEELARKFNQPSFSDRQYLTGLFKYSSLSHRASDDATATRREPSTYIGSNTLVNSKEEKEIQIDFHPNCVSLIIFLRRESRLSEDEQDSEKIEQVMHFTFMDRRNFILIEKPSVQYLQDMYPTLFNQRQLILEFGRCTGIDVQKTFYTNLKLHCSAILQCAQFTSRAIKCFVAAKKNSHTDTERQYVACASALLVLPSLVGENIIDFIKFGREQCGRTFPTITCTLDMENCMIEVPVLKIYAEKLFICKCKDLTEAFLLFVAVHYIFNICHLYRVAKTVTLIEMLLLDLPASVKVEPATRKAKDMILSKHTHTTIEPFFGRVEDITALMRKNCIQCQ